VSAIDVKEECNRAVAAHAKWKLRLKALLDGGGGEVDSATTRRHDGCDLGKWLAGTGRVHLAGDHAAVDAAHRQFHAAAADVVDAFHEGRRQDVERSLAMGGAFSRASATLTNLILSVRNKAR
jgi:hypothetical protein